MGVAIALVLSAAYGAGTQYLGARVPGWGPDVAGLSAPWLALAFVAGYTQRTLRRAVLVGLACTGVALVGYWLMTDSPVEGAHYSLAAARGFFVSNERTVLGGLVAGPVFGWLGHEWRERRTVAGALLLAAALCLEPLARRVSIDPIRVQSVTIAEIAAGLLFAGVVLMCRYRRA
jgi:hypothetical protein